MAVMIIILLQGSESKDKDTRKGTPQYKIFTQLLQDLMNFGDFSRLDLSPPSTPPQPQRLQFPSEPQSLPQPTPNPQHQPLFLSPPQPQPRPQNTSLSPLRISIPFSVQPTSHDVQFGFLYISRDGTTPPNTEPVYYNYSSGPAQHLVTELESIYWRRMHSDLNRYIENIRYNVNVTIPRQFNDGEPRYHTECLLLRFSFPEMRQQSTDPVREIYLYTHFLPCENCTALIKLFLQNISSQEFMNTNGGVRPRLFVGFSTFLDREDEGGNTEARSHSLARRHSLASRLRDGNGMLCQLTAPGFSMLTSIRAIISDFKDRIWQQSTDPVR